MGKRFWNAASVVEVSEGWGVRLDGKPLRLPSGAELVVRAAALAHAVAVEWGVAGGAQGGSFAAPDVPLTGLAGSAQERVRPHRAATIETLAGYGGCDVLCYRVETPQALSARQHVLWQPWLDWAAARYHAPLLVTTGIARVPQPEISLGNLRAALAALSSEALAGLSVIIPALGSCVLGLALADGAIDAATAADLGGLETAYQAERWGWEQDAAERRDRVRDDIATAARFIVLAAG